VDRFVGVATRRSKWENMASGELPAVARRRVRMALREAREKKDLTQSHVAEAMEWSLSKVMRIESGEVTIAPNDLRFLLVFLGITDKATVEQLLQDAKTSRRRQNWSDESRIREHTTPATRQLIQYEAEADVIRHFHGTIIPGRLQTRAYAKSILDSFRGQLSDEDIEVRLDIRMRRRRELLARKPRPQMLVLLDESVLHRSWGEPETTAEQLSDLLTLARENRLLVRIVPFILHDAPVVMLGAFEILNLGDGGEVMYVESDLTDEVIEDPAKIEFNREIYERLWAAAHDEAASLRLIEAQAKALRAGRSGGDRSPG
jgi:transcriptional regulator with XRE-family HTH domain